MPHLPAPRFSSSFPILAREFFVGRGRPIQPDRRRGAAVRSTNSASLCSEVNVGGSSRAFGMDGLESSLVTREKSRFMVRVAVKKGGRLGARRFQRSNYNIVEQAKINSPERSAGHDVLSLDLVSGFAKIVESPVQSLGVFAGNRGQIGFEELSPRGGAGKSGGPVGSPLSCASLRRTPSLRIDPKICDGPVQARAGTS
jgi:hypothetical protein